MTIQRPQGVAFRPVTSAKPIGVNLPAVRETPALDLLQAQQQASRSLEIDCRSAIGPELAALARAVAYAVTTNPSQPSLYDQLLGNAVAVRQLGVDTLERTKRVIDELFDREDFSNLEEAADLLRGLRKDIRKLSNKYNPGDPKVLEFYQRWAPRIIDRLRGIKSVGQLIMIDIAPLKSQMKAIEKDSRVRLEGLDETLAYYDQMLGLSEEEVRNLMYVIAVMEFILERATDELAAMPKNDPSDPLNTRRDKLGRFVRDMDTKITDFKAKLWLDMANGPRILEMQSITQSVALRMVAVINLVIPSMKQAILDWSKTANTVAAANFIMEVTDTFNAMVQQSNRAVAAAVPTMLRATETPMLSVESVHSFAEMYASIVDAIDSELKLGNQRKAELRRAQAEVLGRMLDDKGKITEAYVKSALEAGHVTPPETLATPQDIVLDVDATVEDLAD